MNDDITQKLRVTMPDFKGIEISCPCRIRSSLMTEAADKIERQARHIEELREKIDAEGSCACSFDAPGDICAAHSPALTRALAEVERLTRERDWARADVDRLRGDREKMLLDERDFVRKHRAEIERLTRERDEARAEVERLRDENARLRAQVAEYFREPATHPVEDV